MKEDYIRLMILNSKEKRWVEEKLNEQFGIKEIPGTILRRGEERLFLFCGSLTPEQIKDIESTIPVERVGFYFAKIIHEEVKLSIEGTQILKDKITKNIFSIDDEQTEDWMKGKDLPIETGKKGFIIIEHKGDFLGCGKASEKKIGNFIPKTRRLKERN